MVDRGLKSAKNDGSLIQSVLKALEALDYFAISDGDVGVTEIAEYLGMHKSTASRLLATLNSRGFVSRDPVSRRYSLGMRIVELSQIKLAQFDLVKIAQPFLESLVEMTNETAHLGVLDGGYVVNIHKVDTPQAVGMRSRIGSRTPAHCTALGKAILSELPEERVDKILKENDMVRFTANTITNIDTIRLQFANARQLGYSVDDEENEIGMRCVASAIKNHRGHVVAAISLGGPTFRLTRERIHEIGNLVRQTAQEISQLAGYTKHVSGY